MTAGRRHSAFTLAELLAALAIMGVLMVAMSSAMVIAARALPSDDRPSTRLVRGSSVLQQIADELAEAIAITERGAHAVAFIVADRDGDAAPERIRYAWAEKEDQPLTRSYNGAGPQPVLDNVHDFSLSYRARSQSELYPGPLTDSTEQLLTSFADLSSSLDYPIHRSTWIGQHVTPVLPAGAVSWTIDRAKFRLRKRSSDTGEIRLQIRPATANELPDTTVLDSVTVPESTLDSNYLWHEISYGGNISLSPQRSAFLVIAAVNGKDENAEVQYNGSTGPGIVTTTKGDSSWQAYAGQGLAHYIYGHYRTPEPDQTALRRYVTAIDIALQTGPEPSTRLTTSARTVNEPGVLRACWELEAGQSPALDRNGDALADFNAASSASGLTLTTAPSHDFTDLTTINVRFRDTVAGDSDRAWVYLNADWAGSYCAPLFAGLGLNADGTQALEFWAVDTGGAPVTLVTATGLPDGFVDLRLLVDPALDTVNVQINGADHGTYRYGTRSSSNPAKYALFAPWTGGGAEFEHVTVRVEDSAP